ncbi:hypothetical protein BU16DRAFT_91099 [Lophium mytilinum]|uniref:Uncharacterized protein n=1 Tax=Lophium mytilinum TaxID=390894 RepID=A0A6A6QL54_9PEZI|nr:hypothetical protein BU16DRAFT_91099 [Lophium mytilinum]
MRVLAEIQPTPHICIMYLIVLRLSSLLTVTFVQDSFFLLFIDLILRFIFEELFLLISQAAMKLDTSLAIIFGTVTILQVLGALVKVVMRFFRRRRIVEGMLTKSPWLKVPCL